LTTDKILFDSRDTFFKSPTGAVYSDTELTFNILVSRELTAKSVRLVMLYDRHDRPADYELAQASGDAGAGDHPDHLLYSASVRIHDTGLYWYHFEIATEDEVIFVGKGNGSKAVTGPEPCAWQQTVYRREYSPPEWIYGGIFYHVFVDRFNASGRERIPQEGKILQHNWGDAPIWQPVDGKVLNNDFFGGDLEGIRQKLPYLASLNVTCIYLSPIFEAYSNHKYDTGDYETVDPMFGSEEDFAALCRDAKELGMEVICDGVFAHTGSDSKYFDRYGHYRDRGCSPQGAYLSEDSPYRSWYFFHEDGSYDCWWDFDTLPKANKTEPSYIDYITGDEGIVRKWIRAGAAGWRLDVADELPCSFLESLVAAAKKEKNDSIIIGEVWEDASNKIAYDERKNYFEGNRLDSVMNYPFRSAIIDFIRNGAAETMADTVETILEHYPEEVVHSLMNLLSTHDSLRIITALAGDDIGADPSRELQASTRLDDHQWDKGIEMLRKAVLLQMTLPGVPCIYYGDEAGTEGYKDPFNRTCFPWGKENDTLLGWYRKITSIRTSHRVYRTGSYRTIEASDGIYAFERFDEDESIITVINCGSVEKAIPLGGKNRDLLTEDLFENELISKPGQMHLLRRE